MLRSLESMVDLYIQFKVKVQIQNQNQVPIYPNYFQVQTITREIKYEIQDEFKCDIRKQYVKYPGYLENMKTKFKQVYFTKKIFKV